MSNSKEKKFGKGNPTMHVPFSLFDKEYGKHVVVN